MSEKNSDAFLKALAGQTASNTEPPEVPKMARDEHKEVLKAEAAEHSEMLDQWFTNKLPPKPVWSIEGDEIVCFDEEHKVELERIPHPHPGKKFLEKFAVTILTDVTEDSEVILSRGDLGYAAVTRNGQVALFKDPESWTTIAEGGTEGEDYRVL